MLIRWLSFALLIHLTSNAFASGVLLPTGPECKQDLSDASVTPLNTVTASYDPRATAVGLPPRLSGLGSRGYLGWSPELTPETEAAMQDLGVIYWYSKIFVVDDETAALAQEQKSLRAMDLDKPVEKQTTNVHMGAFYVLAPELKVSKDHDPEDFKRIAREIVHRPIYQVVNGQLVQLDPLVVRERFAPEKMTVMEQFEKEGVQVRAWGWHFANPFGVFILSEMHPQPGHDTIKKLEAKARAAFYPDAKNQVPANQRLVVTFNQDLVGVMKGAQEQERVGQARAANRINDGMIEAFVAMAKKNEAISVETWRETVAADGSVSRQLIGGIFGMNVGGMVGIDSIYYPPGEPDVARFAFLALRDRLEEVGVTFSPATMVSNWSKTLGGRYLSGGEMIQLIDHRSRSIDPDFTSEWAPQAETKVRQRPFGSSGQSIPDVRVSVHATGRP